MHFIQKAKENHVPYDQILNTKFNPRKDFEFVNLIVDGDENRIKAFVNIQKGCDNVCSFCIVPYVRGREVSRPHQDIVREVEVLVEAGVKEITLLGQNVNSYGLKDTDEIDFPELLRKVAATGIERLRFTTSHPKDVDDKLIACYAELENLCPHFHLPVQSGSDSVLERMRRQYTREHYMGLIEKLRAARKNITFSTDMIIGFPNESDEDFEHTMSLLEEVRFDGSFSFIYSSRPYTMAAKYEDNIPKSVKQERLQRFMQRQREIAAQINKDLEGFQLDVLVEDFDLVTQKWMGRSGTNKIVYFGSSNKETLGLGEKLIGQTKHVTIQKGYPHSLTGEIEHG